MLELRLRFAVWNGSVMTITITYDTEVDWPGKGRMTLGNAFRLLRECWQTGDRISMLLLPGGLTPDGQPYPPSIIEAWPKTS